jgi:hypothetical protein
MKNKYTKTKSMKTRIKIVLGLAFALLLSLQTKASGLVGGEIGYTHNGGGNYYVDLTLYVDCSAPVADSLSTTAYSAIALTTIPVTVYKQNDAEITNTCAATTCGAGSTPGVKKVVYRSNIINALPALADWELSYTECCRNAAIDNLDNPGTHGVSLKTTLNNTLGNNSSAKFRFTPASYSFDWNGFPSVPMLNYTVTDADGDAVVYTLIQPRDEFGANIPYSLSGTYSASNPFDFGSMPQLAQGVYYITGAPQYSVVAIRVDEYRSGNLIGSTMREMTIQLTSNPICPGAIANNDNFSVATNVSTVIDVAQNDANALATSTQVLSGPFNGTAIVNNGQISYTSNAGFTGFDSLFYVICNQTALLCDTGKARIFSGNIVVSGTPTQVTCFGNCDGSVIVTAIGGTGPYQYIWSNGMTGQVVTGLCAGSYTVTVVDANNLTGITTINITQPAQITIADFNYPLQPSGQMVMVTPVVTGNPCFPVYTWSNGSTALTATYPNAIDASLTVTDCNGCTAAYTEFIDTLVTPAVNIIDSVELTQPLCVGTASGGVTIFASGGTAPYAFSIDNGVNFQASNTFTNLFAGTYYAVVTDGNGDSDTSVFTLVNPAPIVITFTYPQLPYGQTVTVTPAVTNNLCAVTYLWSNASTVANPSFPNGSVATLTVTDCNGCTASYTEFIDTLNPNPLLVDTIISTPTLCPGSSSGSLTVNASGGIPPYQYSIDGGITFQSSNVFSNLPADIYVVHITDAASGLAINGSFVETNGSNFELLINYTDWPGATDSISVGVATPFSQPITYAWSNGSTTQSTTVSAVGTYCATVTNGVCTASICVDYGCPDCVWPGDADNSGLVDQNDVLAIGQGYGSIGPVRPFPTIDWQGQISADWTDTLPGGINYKHTDCDGNGFIDAEDTLAISLNWGYQHPRSGGPSEPRGGVPALAVDLVPDTLVDGQIVNARLLLGDVNMTASNVYGLAFIFNYDPLVIDSNEVEITFANSWLANTNERIFVRKKQLASGQIAVGLTRIDHTPRSGFGEIGNVAMKVTTGNINGKELDYYSFECFISDLVVVDENGNLLDVTEGSDATEVEYETGIRNIDELNVSVYPNPATNQLFVDLTNAKQQVEQINIVDITGRVIVGGIQPKQSAKISLNIENLQADIYYVQLLSGNLTSTKKFLKF